MFKIKVLPPIFLNNMHFQVKDFYSKLKVKAVVVLVDIEPSRTRRE